MNEIEVYKEINQDGLVDLVLLVDCGASITKTYLARETAEELVKSIKHELDHWDCEKGKCKAEKKILHLIKPERTRKDGPQQP